MVNFDVSGRIALVTGGGTGIGLGIGRALGRVWGPGDPGGPARVRGEGIGRPAERRRRAGGGGNQVWTSPGLQRSARCSMT